MFFASPAEDLDNFQKNGSVVNTPPAYRYMLSVSLSSSCTSYQAGVEYDCFFILTLVQNVQQELRKRLHTFFVYTHPWSGVKEMNTMKNRFVIYVIIVSAMLLSSCTAEDIKNATDQIKTDEQEAIVPRDGTILSGSYAFDNGSGLTNTYLSFTNGKMYEYVCYSTAIFAEGFLWNTSSNDFSLRASGECSISNGTLYRDGVPCGRLRVSENRILLDDVVYGKFSGFKSDHYSVITIEGDVEREINYQKQEIQIPVSVSKIIPAGLLTAQSSADWLVPGTCQGGIYFLHATMYDDSYYNSPPRSATVTFSYPGADNVNVTIWQLGRMTAIYPQDIVQTVFDTEGTYTLSFKVKDYVEGLSIEVSTKNDWISNFVVHDNQLFYKVSPLTDDILTREGLIHLKCDRSSADVQICQRWPVDPSVANSYVISSSGTYQIKTVYGNSTKAIDGISSAEVLWESYGTSETPTVGSIVKDASYSNGIITFSTPSILKNGNAVIAVKDASGNILWSWHIWVCKDFNPVATGQEYYNDAGTMMDRNLGATSATPGTVEALGLLYQWGRKDPFLGSCSISSNTKAASTGIWPSAVMSDGSNGTIEYAVAHPATFITSQYGNWDWFYTGSASTDFTRWQSHKTIYDPCPSGWKVPTGGPSGFWCIASGIPASTYSYYTWDSSNRGMNLSGKFSSASTVWYPAAGYLSCSDGNLKCVGDSGAWWSYWCSDGHWWMSGYSNKENFRLNSTGLIIPSVHPDYESLGQSVRCVQE